MDKIFNMFNDKIATSIIPATGNSTTHFVTVNREYVEKCAEIDVRKCYDYFIKTVESRGSPLEKPNFTKYYETIAVQPRIEESYKDDKNN